MEPLKNIFVKNHWARKAGTNLEAYLGTVDYKLFNHGFLWIYKGHTMESKFYIYMHRKMLSNYIIVPTMVHRGRMGPQQGIKFYIKKYK